MSRFTIKFQGLLFSNVMRSADLISTLNMSSTDYSHLHGVGI